MPLKYYITDVFGSEPYSGNQLATFIHDGSLAAEKMQKIAREINFSETTFIDTSVPGAFKVRIFTPAEEVPFAGHPTLGTAQIVRNHLLSEPQDRLTLDLKVGPVPVSFAEDGIVWMEQPAPVFGPTIQNEIMARVLQLAPDLLIPEQPCQVVSTGLPHIVVPLKSLQALKHCRIDRAAYDELRAATGISCLLVFCPEPYHAGHELSVRMFAEAFGIIEDAATGSGNGCLAAWLVKHRFFGTDSIDIHTAQGYEIGRPSRLSLKAECNASDIAVAVGGRVFELAEGWWF